MMESVPRRHGASRDIQLISNYVFSLPSAKPPQEAQEMIQTINKHAQRYTAEQAKLSLISRKAVGTNPFSNTLVSSQSCPVVNSHPALQKQSEAASSYRLWPLRMSLL